MTPTQTAWLSLYAANKAVNGDQRAAVGAVSNQGRAIISELTMDEILAAGGTAQNGGYNVQMLAIDFSAAPEKQMPVTVLGPTVDPVSSGLGSLQVLSANNNNGIYYIQVGDFVAHE